MNKNHDYAAGSSPYPAEQTWTEASEYSFTPSNEYTLSITSPDNLLPGTPIRYTLVGDTNFYYGAVAVVNLDQVEVFTQNLSGLTLETLWIGKSCQIVQVDLFVSGIWDDSVRSLMDGIMKTEVLTKWPAAFLVYFTGYCDTLDSGDQQPSFDVTIDGVSVTDGTGVPFDENDADSSPPTYISGTANAAFFGANINITCSEPGDNQDAENLTVSLMFVLE